MFNSFFFCSKSFGSSGYISVVSEGQGPTTLRSLKVSLLYLIARPDLYQAVSSTPISCLNSFSLFFTFIFFHHRAFISPFTSSYFFSIFPIIFSSLLFLFFLFLVPLPSSLYHILITPYLSASLSHLPPPPTTHSKTGDLLPVYFHSSSLLSL